MLAGTYNGATITSTTFNTATISGGTLSGGNVSGGTLTASAVNSLNVSGTAISGTGALSVAAGGTNTNLSLDGNGTGQVLIGGTSTGDILLGGGSGSSGCTVTNSSGNLACAGNINSVSGVFQLNGADINTAGTLSNVAYLNQANTFSAANTFSSTVAVQGAGGLTLGVAGTTTGNLNLANSASARLVVLQGLNPSGTGNATVQIPTIAGGSTDTVCLLTLGNCAGAGGGVTATPGGIAGTIARFDAAQNIVNSIITETGGNTINITGALNVSTNTDLAGTLFVGTADAFQVAANGNVLAGTYNGATITSTTFNTATISGGTLSGGNVSGGTLTASAVNSLNVSGTAISGTGALSVAAGGTNTNLSLDGNGTGQVLIGGTSTGDILLGGGSGSSGCTVTNSSGNLACAGNINSVSGVFQLNGADINTAGTLSNVAYLNQANTFSAANTFSSTVAVQGAGGLTLGVAGTTTGNLNLANSASARLVVLQGLNPSGTGNATVQIPTIAGGSTDTVCLLTLGNCAGAGGGVTATPGGIAGTIARFDAAQNIVNSIITETGGNTINITGALNVSTNTDLAGTLFVGTADAFQVAANGNVLAGTYNGATITSTTFNTATISGGTLSGGNVSGGTLTASAVNSLNVSGTAISGTGALSVAAGGTNTNLSLDGNGTGQVLIGGTSTGDILLGGGSGSSGCTVTNSSGNLACAGNINSVSGVFQLNGADINTAGTLSNVAYLNQANTFSAANTFSSTVAVQGAGGLTLGVAGTTTGNLNLANSASARLVVLQGLNPSGTGNATVQIPTIAGGSTDTVCLLTLGNCAGAGGGVTATPGGIAGTIARFDAAQNIVNSIITETGGNTINITGALNVSTNTDLAGTLFVGTADAFQVAANGNVLAGTYNGATITSTTFNTATISGGTLSGGNVSGGTLTASAVNSLNVSGTAISGTGALSVAAGGTNTNLSLDGNGTGQVLIGGTSTGDILLGGGSGSSGCTVTNSSGNLACAGNINSVSGVFQLNGADINTAGTLSNVAYLNQANTFSAANTFSSTVAVQGAGGLTLGVAGTTTGNLNLANSASARLVVLQGLNPSGTGNATVQIPTIAGGSTDTVCLLTLGNCAGAGGGVTATPGGIAGTIARFDAAQNIVNSIITETGGNTINITGALNVSTNTDLAGTLFVGTADAFQVAANGNVLAGTYNGATITSTTFNTATISGGTLSGGNVSGGTLTASAVNSLNVSGTAISGTGALSVAAGGTNTNLSLDGNGTGQVLIGGTSTGDILLGGGSGSSGCTVTNSSGNLACAGNINSVSGVFQLNGADINTAGTLSNVAYLNQANTFSAANTFSSTVAVQGAGGLTLGVAGTTTGNLNLANSASARLVVLQGLNPSGTGNATVQIPTIAGGSTDTVCLLTLGNCAGAGGGVTATPGGIAGTIARFDAAQNIVNSIITETGGNTINITGALNVSTNTDLAGTLFVGTADAFQVAANGNVLAGTYNGATITSTTFNTATISGGTLSGGNVSGGTLTASAVNSLNVSGTAISGTGALSVAAGGTNTNLSLDGNGTGQVLIGGTSTGDILLGGGSGSSGCTVTNSSGNLACAGNINSVSGVFQLNGADINTAGTLSNVAYLNQANTFSAANTFSSTVAVQGAGGLTLGVAGTTTGNLNLANSASARLVVLQGLNPSGTGNATVQIPTIAGGSTDTVCLLTLGNCAGAGGGVTATPGGIAGTIARFDAAQNIVNSIITETGGNTINITGALNVSTNTDLAGTLFVGTADAFQVAANGNVLAGTYNGATITSTTFNTATISGGTLSGGNVSGGTLTASAVNSLNVSGTAISGTGALSVAAGGTNTNLSLDGNGTGQVLIGGTSTGDILLGGGSGSSGCTVTNSSGNLACAGNINSVSGVFQLNGADINTAGTLSNVAYLNQANTFSAANTFSSTVAVQGAGGLTLGVAGTTTGNLNLANSASARLVVLQGLNPSGTGNATVQIPTIAGGSTDTVCLLTLGNCAGAGGGVTATPGGIAGTIARFDAAQNIVNSTLTESGSVVTASGTVVIQGASSLTLGVASTNTGSIAFKNSTNGNTVTLQSGASGSDFSLTLPTTGGNNGDCLQSTRSRRLSFRSLYRWCRWGSYQRRWSDRCSVSSQCFRSRWHHHHR